MNTHADKTQKKESQVGSLKSSGQEKSADSVFKFSDNRFETFGQQTFQRMAVSGPQALQLRAYQESVNKYSKTQSGGGVDSSVAQLSIAQDNWDAAISHTRNTWADHIFNGGLKNNGNPNGYHSKAGNSPTHEAFGVMNKSVGPKGVYNQQVRLKSDHSKTKLSTFFPDGLTQDQVIATVASAHTQQNKEVVSKGSLKPGVPPQLIGSKIHFADDTAYPEV